MVCAMRMEEILRPVVVAEGVDVDPVRNQMIALLPRLRRFALSLTGSRADADDLVQDTVERALRNLDKWERGTRLDSWMFRIAQNLFIDGTRARKRAGAVVVNADSAMLNAAMDGARAADAQVEFSRTREALLRLPEDQRIAMALVLIDGMAYRDAAEVLGVPIGTLTSRLARARTALAASVFGTEV